MTVALEFKGRPRHLRRRKNSSPSGPTFEHLISCLLRGLEVRIEPVELADLPTFHSKGYPFKSRNRDPGTEVG